MSGCIDLHLHSSYSDGTLQPDRLLQVVRQKKLAAFSITDHDTLEGYREAKKLVKEGDPELVPGVELSVLIDDEDMHLLVYLCDPDDEVLGARLREFQSRRNQRARLIVERLNRQGLEVPYDTVQKTADGAVIGRPHIAQAMVELGMISSFDEAFRKFIGTDCPAYVPKAKLLPEDAIRMAHDAGGVTVLAHPLIGRMHRHIEMLADLGLDGIEVYHYSHNKSDVKQLKRLATQYRLLQAGGSDFHGRYEQEMEIGSQWVPSELLDELKHQALQQRGST
jgi:predicted metal-dependent phosphoesterase TrpH